MSDRPARDPAKGPSHAEPATVDVDAATRRLMAALDALESAVERRRDADRDEDELASRIHALGTDRSRLADELDGALVKSRRLERANREIAERLDTAIGTIRAVLDGKDEGAKDELAGHDEEIEHDGGEPDEEHDDAPHLGALNEEEDEDEEEEDE